MLWIAVFSRAHTERDTCDMSGSQWLQHAASPSRLATVYTSLPTHPLPHYTPPSFSTRLGILSKLACSARHSPAMYLRS